MNELEFIFEKITEIENKSHELKENTKKEMDAKDLKLNREIESFDNKSIETMKIELEKEHAQSIKDSQNAAQVMLKESDDFCKNMINNYTSIKNELTKKIVNDIIALH